jgi:tetratricopeptide (TPR) repeat protein
MLAKMTNTAKDNEMINYLISVYKQKSIENPNDYRINVKLGHLYGLIFDYPQSEKQYRKAITKSPYGVYSPYFGLANLYVKEKKYKKALAIVKRLENKDYKPLLITKGDFYINVGDSYWNDGDYENAVKYYKVAFFFYKKTDSQKKEIAINGIIDCYNKISDKYYKNNKHKEAVESLETAILYKETAIIYYKLALLYREFDLVKACEYMEKTYKIDPALINYDIYEEILIGLANYYYVNGKDIEKELYLHKLKAIKNFQKRYVITEKDVRINITKLKYKSNWLSTKYNLDVTFNIANDSKYDFNTLYLIVKLKYDDKEKELFSEKLYSKKNPLKPRKESTEYNIKYSYTDKDEIFGAKKLSLDFYAGKKENMRKIPIYSVEIKK